MENPGSRYDRQIVERLVKNAPSEPVMDAYEITEKQDQVSLKELSKKFDLAELNRIADDNLDAMIEQTEKDYAMAELKELIRENPDGVVLMDISSAFPKADPREIAIGKAAVEAGLDKIGEDFSDETEAEVFNATGHPGRPVDVTNVRTGEKIEARVYPVGAFHPKPTPPKAAPRPTYETPEHLTTRPFQDFMELRALQGKLHSEELRKLKRGKKENRQINPKAKRQR